MSILKQISSADGLRQIDNARRYALDPDWFAETTEKYAADIFFPAAGRRPASIEEFDGNITDLIVFYSFADAPRLVGKFFLPVVKTRPWLGFEGLDDRGNGIDRRMRIMAAATAPVGVNIPQPYYYDSGPRVLWMEYIGDNVEHLQPKHWEWALPRIGQAIARAHGTTISDEILPLVENTLFRKYLIEYPFIHLEPYINRAGYQNRWREFLAADAAARRSLIHGDFKQHNIGVTGDGLWFIDLERSNYANPAYDVGWFLCHLLIEAWDAEKPAATALNSFLDAYTGEYKTEDAFDFCAANYMLLFLAYRIVTYDILALNNGETVNLLERVLRRAFKLTDYKLSSFIKAICELAA